MMEPLPYPCMPQYTFNSVPKWTQLEIVKSGNFPIYMYTCIWHIMVTVDRPNIPDSTKIWRAIYLANAQIYHLASFIFGRLPCLYITNMMQSLTIV